MSTIELSNVSRWYGNVVAVNDITMDIGPGVTGLLGPNGAGKSTILHMMAGFLEPSKGTLTVDGATTWKNPEIYRKLGLVPERDSVYAFLTGDQFVTATAKLHKLPDPQGAARRAIGITEMSAAQDRKISTYSKGMRQRIILIAALMDNPDVLILDEPLSGLDVTSALIIKNLIQALSARGKTIFYCSHILEVVEKVCSHLIILRKGQVIAQGPTTEVCEQIGNSSLEGVFLQLVEERDVSQVANEIVDVVVSA